MDAIDSLILLSNCVMFYLFKSFEKRSVCWPCAAGSLQKVLKGTTSLLGFGVRKPQVRVGVLQPFSQGRHVLSGVAGEVGTGIEPSFRAGPERRFCTVLHSQSDTHPKIRGVGHI